MAAEKLGVTRGALHQWLAGHQRPKPHLRAAIEAWTGGAVPAPLWATDEEREAVAGVEPFEPTGTGR